jgi:hypothetical protein
MDAAHVVTFLLLFCQIILLLLVVVYYTSVNIPYPRSIDQRQTTFMASGKQHQCQAQRSMKPCNMECPISC